MRRKLLLICTRVEYSDTARNRGSGGCGRLADWDNGGDVTITELRQETQCFMMTASVDLSL